MKNATTPTSSRKGIQTTTLAARFDCSPATIRKNLCLKGHVWGIKPLCRLPNGRNLWPDVWPADVVGR